MWNYWWLKKKNLHEQIKSILDVFQPANSFSLNDFPSAATATKGFEARREKKNASFLLLPLFAARRQLRWLHCQSRTPKQSSFCIAAGRVDGSSTINGQRMLLSVEANVNQTIWVSPGVKTGQNFSSCSQKLISSFFLHSLNFHGYCKALAFQKTKHLKVSETHLHIVWVFVWHIT